MRAPIMSLESFPLHPARRGPRGRPHGRGLRQQRGAQREPRLAGRLGRGAVPDRHAGTRAVRGGLAGRLRRAVGRAGLRRLRPGLPRDRPCPTACGCARSPWSMTPRSSTSRCCRSARRSRCSRARSRAAGTSGSTSPPSMSPSTAASPTAGSPIADHDGTPWVAVSGCAAGGPRGRGVGRRPGARCASPTPSARPRRDQRLRARPVPAAARGESRRQGRRHVAHQHRVGARDGPRRRHWLDRVADGRGAACQRLGRPRQRLGSLEQLLNGAQRDWEDDEGNAACAVAEHGQHARSARTAGRSSRRSSTGSRVPSGPGSRSSTTSPTPTPLATPSTPGSQRQTHDRIKKLLGPPDVTTATRLALVNAIYMKANWANEFDPDRTVNRPFATSIDTTHQGPDDAHDGRTGHRARAGPGLEGDGAAVRRGERLRRSSMTLILPDDLGRFEAGLSAAKLDAIRQAIAT